MAKLNVTVHATHRHDASDITNDMVLVTEVTDQDGDPVTDLKVSSFKVWQVGISSFGDIDVLALSHLGSVHPDLNGIYPSSRNGSASWKASAPSPSL